MSPAAKPPVGIVIAGAAGRMGRMLVGLASSNPSLRVLAALEAPEHPQLGVDAGRIAGGAELGVPLAASVSGVPAGSVLIDFTAPDPTLEHVRVAAAHGWGAIVGTTGFRPEQEREIDLLGERIPLLRAANMSVGVTVLLDVAKEVAHRLGGSFDIEIAETHHRLKKDAPSGTALALGRAVAAGRGVVLQEHAVYGRDGLVGERPDGEIGVMALRGGDVVGDHTVFFFGTGERIELTHRAQSREAFAAGALRAAAWIAGRPPGLYEMRDVLSAA